MSLINPVPTHGDLKVVYVDASSVMVAAWPWPRCDASGRLIGRD